MVRSLRMRPRPVGVLRIEANQALISGASISATRVMLRSSARKRLKKPSAVRCHSSVLALWLPPSWSSRKSAMARSRVVAERRLESRSSCPLRLREFFRLGVLEAACWRRASAWASSLSRWATARASVTLEDGFGERGETMGNPLFLVVGSQPCRQEAGCHRCEAGCRALVKAGCRVFCEAGCRCAPFCTIKHRLPAYLFTAWLFPTGVKSACKETMYFEERETGLEPATACLEGRVSQDRRSPGMKWLWGPIEQL